MKPEIQIKLLKKLENLKLKQSKFSYNAAMAGVIFFSIIFVSQIGGMIESISFNKSNVPWLKSIFLLISLGVLLVNLYWMIESRMNKKIISLIEAILDKSEEPIQKEKIELDEID